jgi:transposase
MNIHKNARLTPRSRADLVRRVMVKGQIPKAVATAFGVSDKTVNKWVKRFKAEGPQGLLDRTVLCHRQTKTSSPIGSTSPIGFSA